MVYEVLILYLHSTLARTRGKTKHLIIKLPAVASPRTAVGLQAPSSKEDPNAKEVRRDVYLSTVGRGSYVVLAGIGVCAVVEGACEEVDWGWDVELVGEKEQEVVLILILLLEWSILGLGGRYFLNLVPGT